MGLGNNAAAAVAAAAQPVDLVPEHAPTNMVWIAGGTYRMGSDHHYPEEAPAHRVTVDGFWIDRTPVTNREFRRFARHAEAVDTSTSHLGFRLIVRKRLA